MSTARRDAASLSVTNTENRRCLSVKQATIAQGKDDVNPVRINASNGVKPSPALGPDPGIKPLRNRTLEF